MFLPWVYLTLAAAYCSAHPVAVFLQHAPCGCQVQVPYAPNYCFHPSPPVIGHYMPPIMPRPVPIFQRTYIVRLIKPNATIPISTTTNPPPSCEIPSADATTTETVRPIEISTPRPPEVPEVENSQENTIHDESSEENSGYSPNLDQKSTAFPSYNDLSSSKQTKFPTSTDKKVTESETVSFEIRSNQV